MSDLITVKINERTRYQWEVKQRDCICQRCGAPIWWVETHNGKLMPVNEPDSEDAGTVTSHFGNCYKGT